MDESLINSLIEGAANIARKEYGRSEIRAVLKGGNELEKPIAVLSLDVLENEDDALLLIQNLTGCDGRIREACAHKISEFLSNRETANFFLDEQSVKTILNGIMDINPNVGRALIYGIKECPALQERIFPFLIEKTEELIKKLEALSDTPFKENKLNNKRNHAKNKIVFNLYWALEALYYTGFDPKYEEKINSILKFTSAYLDYTIREKAAQILSKMENKPPELLHKLKNDENFYVKNHLLC